MNAIINAVIISGMFLIFSPMLQAAETAAHASPKDSKMNMEGMAKAPEMGSFLKQKTIDDYTVTFNVLKVAPGMEHGGSHNLMVKVERDGKTEILSKILAKVILADGTSNKKTLFKMDDWYMNGFDLGSPGKHQLIILFKTADGAKHNGGVYFEAAGNM